VDRSSYLQGAAIGLALVATFLSGRASAQDRPNDAPATSGDAPAEAEAEIVVTGSLLARSDATSTTPISVIGSEQILDSGTLSISDVLRKDPALGSQSRGPGTGLNGAGINAVDLRNLGNQRTLALVNGRRYPKFSDVLGNSGQDITGIPSYLIRRVEVLRDGASTTYGADAVAGVVNFILNDKADGLTLDAYSGISDRGDGFSYRISGLLGIASNRGSLVFGAGYQHQDDIPQQNRDWAIPIVTGFTAAGAPIYATTFTPGGRVTSANAVPGSPANTLLACYPVGGGTTNLAPTCGTYDGALQTSLYSASTVKSAGVIGRYELTDNIRAKIDAFYTNRSSSQDIAAIQANTGSTLGVYPSGFVIPSTNSNNPYGRDIRLTWRPAQYGPRSTITDSDTLFANFGFDGTVFGDWRWEITHTYGKTRSNQRTLNQLDSTAFFNLLNPSACAANPVCAGIGPIANIAALLQQATPLTDAQRDYLLKDASADISFVSQQTLATFGGTIFKLPAGDVGLAIGLEHRTESGTIRPDAVVQSGVLVGSQVLETDGKFSTNEAFAELNVPLLANAPFFHELTLNLQGRYSDFSNFGGAETYKIGLNWSPIEDIRFRGAYGTSFRAPDVLELYSGGAVATNAVQDPCNAAGLRATNATVNANCTALGVPANFQQPQTALPYRLEATPNSSPRRAGRSRSGWSSRRASFPASPSRLTIMISGCATRSPAPMCRTT
jgi:iron complex outermembrane receptor protein